MLWNLILLLLSKIQVNNFDNLKFNSLILDCAIMDVRTGEFYGIVFKFNHLSAATKIIACIFKQ